MFVVLASTYEQTHLVTRICHFPMGVGTRNHTLCPLPARLNILPGAAIGLASTEPATGTNRKQDRNTTQQIKLHPERLQAEKYTESQKQWHHKITEAVRVIALPGWQHQEQTAGGVLVNISGSEKEMVANFLMSLLHKHLADSSNRSSAETNNCIYYK